MVKKLLNPMHEKSQKKVVKIFMVFERVYHVGGLSLFINALWYNFILAIYDDKYLNWAAGPGSGLKISPSVRLDNISLFTPWTVPA